MSAVAQPDAPPSTGRRRRATGWIAIAAVLIGVGIAGSALAGIGEWTERDALDPESAGPDGTRAIVEILRERGVDVIVARDRAAVRSALEAGPATLALADAPALSDDAVIAVTDAADDVVLVDPRARTLRVLIAGTTPYGVGPGEAVDPECGVAEAVRAGEIAPGAVYQPGEGAAACYPTGGGYGLIVTERTRLACCGCRRPGAVHEREPRRERQRRPGRRPPGAASDSGLVHAGNRRHRPSGRRPDPG